MAKDCIFCKITSGEIPAEKVFESEDLVAFKDINPAAPVHLLIVPKVHIPTLNDINDEHAVLIGKMFSVGRDLAKKANVHENGYRMIINCNRDAGQEVFHLHLHLLGGQPLGKMVQPINP